MTTSETASGHNGDRDEAGGSEDIRPSGEKGPSDETGGVWIVYSDGASRGNPGLASIGAALYRVSNGRQTLVGRVSEAIGHATNNVAEYKAMIEGLKLAQEHEPDHLVVRADSQLLIRQLEGRYRVKNVALQPLYLEAKRLLRTMPHTLEHVPREENSVADAFANDALDRGVWSPEGPEPGK